jgi:hypothetical protein
VSKCSTVILKVTLAVLLILCCGVSFAQLGGMPEKTALKNIQKHRWEKAELKLRKTLHKDTVSASIRYILSAFYFNPLNPGYNLASAYHYAVTALEDYQITSYRERDKLRRMPLDSLQLVSLREKIDSAAFEEARNTNTETAYLQFLRHFTSASQRTLAMQLRDEVAYQDALKENTHRAFLYYINRYPAAKRVPEARAHYDRLLYHSQTKDKRLSSFEKFLADHPETPYREEIYRNIFEISTADGSVENFLAFIERYPLSDLVKTARKLIFHILAEEENPKWPGKFLNDSLQNLLSIQNTYLVPVLKNDLYGFINENGQEIIPPKFKNIHPDYLCGNITDEVLILDNQLLARNGSLIYDGKIEEVTELGIGFLKIRTGDHVKVIHKAGFVFADSIQDARILNKRYLTLKKNNDWLLYTLTGRQLDDNKWDDITAFQDIILFESDEKKYIAAKTELGRIAAENDLKLSKPFDEVKKWPYDLIWVKTGELQGVLDQSLRPVMRFDKHILTQTFFGATAVFPNGINLYNWAGQEALRFQEVNIYSPWVAVKKSESWFLFEPHLQEIESKPYDTIKAEGPFVMGLLKDTVYVHFTKNKIKQFIQPLGISFVPGMDSTSFLVVEDKDHKKSVFDLKGKKLFSAAFDAVEYAGQGIFVITRKDKKGLINAAGEILLPAEFDAIGSVKDRVVSVLKSKRFGCYQIARKKFIKPQYDRNLHPYTDQLLATFKDGYYGFLGWDNKPLSKFEFDEIRYWDDSIAMVKKGGLWNFYNIPSKRTGENNLRNIVLIKNAPDEKIAIIQKDNAYGVISNQRNVVIPVSFTDIINLGSAEEPLYFTEKHIKEASLFIVIYYDRFGNMLRKEIYDEVADYDKIYCSDN